MSLERVPAKRQKIIRGNAIDEPDLDNSPATPKSGIVCILIIRAENENRPWVWELSPRASYKVTHCQLDTISLNVKVEITTQDSQ